jgi:hypothetical protein
MTSDTIMKKNIFMTKNFKYCFIFREKMFKYCFINFTYLSILIYRKIMVLIVYKKFQILTSSAKKY